MLWSTGKSQIGIQTAKIFSFCLFLSAFWSQYCLFSYFDWVLNLSPQRSTVSLAFYHPTPENGCKNILSSFRTTLRIFILTQKKIFLWFTMKKKKLKNCQKKIFFPKSCSKCWKNVCKANFVGALRSPRLAVAFTVQYLTLESRCIIVFPLFSRTFGKKSNFVKGDHRKNFILG